MGKKILFVVLTVALITSVVATNAYCDNALKKLGRGLCNCITFPFELFEQIKRTNLSDGPMAAMTYGLVQGIGMMGVRAVVGVYEVATFPIAFPKHYAPILTDPEFFFEEKNW